MRLLALLLALQTSHAAAQSVYVNERYDVMATIPQDFVQFHASSSGDGAEFSRLGDKTAMISVFAGISLWDDLDNNAALLAEREQRLAWMTQDYDVTYAPIGKSWFVLSGTDRAGQIAYARTQMMQACDERTIFGTVFFECGPADREFIEPLIGPISCTLDVAPC